MQAQDTVLFEQHFGMRSSMRAAIGLSDRGRAFDPAGLIARTQSSMRATVGLGVRGGAFDSDVMRAAIGLSVRGETFDSINSADLIASKQIRETFDSINSATLIASKQSSIRESLDSINSATLIASKQIRETFDSINSATLIASKQSSIREALGLGVKGGAFDPDIMRDTLGLGFRGGAFDSIDPAGLIARTQSSIRESLDLRIRGGTFDSDIMRATLGLSDRGEAFDSDVMKRNSVKDITESVATDDTSGEQITWQVILKEQYKAKGLGHLRYFLSSVWSFRWVAKPVGYLLPRDDREEWLGDLEEIHHLMLIEDEYPIWFINLIIATKTLLLAWRAIEVHIVNLFDQNSGA